MIRDIHSTENGVQRTWKMLWNRVAIRKELHTLKTEVINAYHNSIQQYDDESLNQRMSNLIELHKNTEYAMKIAGNSKLSYLFRLSFWFDS